MLVNFMFIVPNSYVQPKHEHNKVNYDYPRQWEQSPTAALPIPVGLCNVPVNSNAAALHTQ
jgi:hypothetical protein